MDKIEDYPDLLTVKEMAEILHISYSWASQITHWTVFPAQRTGGRKVKVNKEDLVEWICNQEMLSVKPEVLKEIIAYRNKNMDTSIPEFMPRPKDQRFHTLMENFQKSFEDLMEYMQLNRETTEEEEQKKEDQLLTIKEVADILRIASGTVYKLIRDKDLPAFTIGNIKRVKKDELLEWMKQRNEY